MNLLELAPTAFVVALAVLLIAAALEDAVRLRISNILILLVLVAGIAAAVVVGPTWNLLQNVANVAVVLLLGSFAFAAGQMGGGDVKLLAAIAFWVDFSTGVWLLATVLIVGGLLALTFITVRSITGRGRARRPKEENRLPYGIAISAGTLTLFPMLRAWF